MKSNQESVKEKHHRWHQDPKNWRWGVFYYNKEDSRIFPPKRFSYLGWTINFANPKSVIVFVIMLLLILVGGFLLATGK